METYQIIVKGRVQGVGYRAHIYQNASQKDLHGNVRNLSDGSVQIILQGTEEDLKNIESYIIERKAKLKESKEYKKESHFGSNGLE